MTFSTTIVPNHEISIGASPQNADLAIVPIDSSGTLGKLNQYVLEEYGYSAKNLPAEKDLQNGFAAINTDGKKPILFVVTVNSEKTSINLETNLYNTLTEFQGWYRGKKVWIPLMGSGTGGLELVESFTITARAINKALKNYPTKVTFILSLPDSPTGRKLFSELQVVTSNQHIEAKKFLSRFDCNFYLAGSFWGPDNDQTERFIEQSIWEKGHDDETYSPIINDVRKGDILIIKSTFARNGISYLKIKAVGIVIENLLNGRELNVSWRIKGLSQDIQNLGHYRSTITEISLPDAITIFSNIDSQFWGLLLLTIDINTVTSQAPISLSAPDNRIAGLISDTEKGTDYLDISKDVTAFARVIAAKSFDPPLAIALLGKWGSGKSFFMRKLKQQVGEFSDFQASNIYCKGVAHIHFNAWSYMDANLWASIVSKIFEGLNEYISKNSLPGEAKKEIEQELSSKLIITKEEIGVLVNKKDALESKISDLEKKRTKLNKTLEDQIGEVKMTTLWEVIQKANREFKVRERIINTLHENPSFVKTEAELKEIIPEKYWSDPEAAYQQIKSKYTFLREFFKKGRFFINLLWLAVILLIIYLMPFLLERAVGWISRINFLIPQATLSILVSAGIIWRRAESVYNELKPVVASFWTIRMDYEKKVREATFKFEQEAKLLELKIEKGRAEIAIIDEQIQNAETIKSDIEFKINHALATESLYSFIDKRSKSDDYKKHLGIISVIRKDFETLNSLFVDHHEEVDKVTEDLREKFKQKFSKPLERIILYIDDLDRCPEDNVVQVLEAVNLLMAFPLFIVIVGVDPRWIKNALVKKHAVQFDKHLEDRSRGDFDILDPSSYLEKIFQVPFHLKEAKEDNVKVMIRELANLNPIPEKKGTANDVANIQSTLEENEINSHDENNNIIDDGALVISEDSVTIEELTELLILTNEEVVLMQDMSEIIGNNPRAIKRFVNTFRIVKAHGEFSHNVALADKELPVILLLLALPLGKYRALLPSFERYIEKEENFSKPITLYLQPIHKIGLLDELKHRLNVILSVKPSFGIIERTPSSIFLKHISFIKRFTFDNI